MNVHYLDLTTFEIILRHIDAVTLYNKGRDIAVFDEFGKKACEWNHERRN